MSEGAESSHSYLSIVNVDGREDLREKEDESIAVEFEQRMRSVSHWIVFEDRHHVNDCPKSNSTVVPHLKSSVGFDDAR